MLYTYLLFTFWESKEKILLLLCLHVRLEIGY